MLTFTTLWANSADGTLMIFFTYFPQKTGFGILCFNVYEYYQTCLISEVLTSFSLEIAKG